jgi:hypothetical protein
MKDMEINFSLTDSGGETINFTSFNSLRDFCVKERDFWSAKKKLVSETGIASRSTPQQFNVASQLMQLVDWVDDAHENVITGGASWVKQQLRDRYKRVNRNKWLYSGHPYTQAFIDCSVQYGGTAAEAFLSYIQKKQAQLVNPPLFDHLKGYVAAYEFENQNSDLVKRRKGERAAIGKVRKEFVESKDQLFSEVAALKNDYENLSAEAKQALVEELESWQQQRAENNEKVDQSLTQYNKSVSGAIDAHNAEIEAIKEESRNKIREFEETYEERLRLEPAATYWKDSARRLRIQGVFFAVLIIGMVGAGLFAGKDLFETWLSHEKLPLDLTSLQGVLITITVLAIYAYILRLLSRLTFSSFHLMRDAEEREQLTYLYLALSNETDVDEKSREIVLQALFSRSETGLLTNEHGPVMPGMDLNQLLKGMGR